MTDPTTPTGKRLLASDFDTTGWGPRVVREYVTEAVLAIEREAREPLVAALVDIQYTIDGGPPYDMGWLRDRAQLAVEGHVPDDAAFVTVDSLAAALRALDDEWGATVPSYADAHSRDEYAAAIIQAAKEAEREV